MSVCNFLFGSLGRILVLIAPDTFYFLFFKDRLSSQTVQTLIKLLLADQSSQGTIFIVFNVCYNFKKRYVQSVG